MNKFLKLIPILIVTLSFLFVTAFCADVKDMTVVSATEQSSDDLSAYATTMSDMEEDYDDDDSGSPFLAIVIGIVGGIIIAFVVTGNMVSKMNTARKKTEAANYIRQGSFIIGQSSDRFMYENTERTAKPKQNK